MFAEKFKELRESLDINQKDMAKLLNVGPSTVSMWEQDKRTPDKDMLVRIADFFDVSTDYLLGRTNEKNDLAILKLKSLDNNSQEEILKLIKNLPVKCNEKDENIIRVQMSNRTLSLTLKELTALINYMDSVGISIDTMLENSLKHNIDNKKISN